jgi:hypothetical protein
MSTEPNIKVDFNNITPDGLIRAYKRLAADPAGLIPGMNVVLYDGEGGGLGNRCLGIVRSVSAKIVLVEAIESTWLDAEPVRVKEGDLVSVLFDQIVMGTGSDTMTIPHKDELART